MRPGGVHAKHVIVSQPAVSTSSPASLLQICSCSWRIILVGALCTNSFVVCKAAFRAVIAKAAIVHCGCAELT